MLGNKIHSSILGGFVAMLGNKIHSSIHLKYWYLVAMLGNKIHRDLVCRLGAVARTRRD